MHLQRCITMLRKNNIYIYTHVGIYICIHILKTNGTESLTPNTVKTCLVAPGTTATPFGKPSRKQPAKAQENRLVNSPKMKGCLASIDDDSWSQLWRLFSRSSQT